MPATIRTIPASIANRLRLNRSALANLRIPGALPDTRRPRRRFARFVIQTQGAAVISDVIRVVQSALGGTRISPVTGMTGGRFVGRSGANAQLSSTFSTRILLPAIRLHST
jgi:hypothetical protein